MADVFVSYHKRDRTRAEQAVASLVANGFTVWWDERVTPLETWDRTVEREIAQAKCVLVLWTAESVDSDWVRIEANFAKVARPAKLVQVRLEECTVPINFSMLQYTDAFSDSFDPKGDEGWERALDWVGLFVGVRPESVSAAPVAPPPKKKRAKRIPAPVVADDRAPVEPQLPESIPARAAPPPPQQPSPQPLPMPLSSSLKLKIDPGEIISGALARVTKAVSAFVNTGGYYRRGMIMALLGALVGGLIYYWTYRIYVSTDNLFARFIAAYLLRACAGAALAYVFVTTGRLARDRAIIFAALFVAINLVYRLWSFVFANVFTPPVMLQGVIGDVSGMALLFLIARQLGAFRTPRNFPLLWIALGLNVMFAVAVGANAQQDALPGEYDAAGWASLLALSLIFESWLALVLIQPMRTASPSVGSQSA